MMKKIAILTLLIATACIVRSKSAQDKFITYEHSLSKRNLLMSRVHESNWKIGYRYGIECQAKDRQDEQVKQTITTALEAWLAPLQQLNTKQPLISSTGFRFHRHSDDQREDIRDVPSPADIKELRTVHMQATLRCRQGRGGAVVSKSDLPPKIYISWGENKNRALSALTHELGHAFGMADTYIGSILNPEAKSSGGLPQTVGMQPSSVMSFSFPRAKLGEDDKRGIVWLYNYFHEGLKLENCFFPDYVLEKDPLGCRPKHPLIYEVKHGISSALVYDIIDKDPSINVNAQDAGGMTALHHAAALGRKGVVERLLAHKDINPVIKNKKGKTALDLARTKAIAELLQAATPALVEDLNGDGTVNILDLVLVSHSFGKSGENKADVNSDGKVDIRDLVLVASKFGTQAGAPQYAKMSKYLTSAQVANWLSAARQQAITDPDHRRGVAVLENLLASARPQRTALLANYPNPFNTETWLPYQLAEPAKVTIGIYTSDGKLIRSIALGNLPAGSYLDKSRAAYWDGKNTQGEQVASGVYFYTLSAGDFSATRKMFLRK